MRIVTLPLIAIAWLVVCFNAGQAGASATTLLWALLVTVGLLSVHPRAGRTLT